MTIVSALWRQLSWTHLRRIISLDDALKRDFYMVMCRLERWSTRQLTERIESLRYERTALFRKPEKTVRHDVEHLRFADAGA